MALVAAREESERLWLSSTQTVPENLEREGPHDSWDETGRAHEHLIRRAGKWEPWCLDRVSNSALGLSHEIWDVSRELTTIPVGHEI